MTESKTDEGEKSKIPDDDTCEDGKGKTENDRLNESGQDQIDNGEREKEETKAKESKKKIQDDTITSSNETGKLHVKSFLKVSVNLHKVCKKHG